MTNPRRRILQSVGVALALMACIVIAAIVVPGAALFAYIAAVLPLEVLEQQGWGTLTGSPDGWPVPTTLGWWVIATITWGLLAFIVYIVLRTMDWRRGRA